MDCGRNWGVFLRIWADVGRMFMNLSDFGWIVGGAGGFFCLRIFADFGRNFANLSDFEWTLGEFWWIWVPKGAWRGTGRPKSRLGGSRGHPRGQKVDFAHGLGSPILNITGDQEQKSKVQGSHPFVGLGD